MSAFSCTACKRCGLITILMSHKYPRQYQPIYEYMNYVINIYLLEIIFSVYRSGIVIVEVRGTVYCAANGWRL